MTVFRDQSRHPDTPANDHSADGYDLVAIEQVVSPSERIVVATYLKSNGIPAIIGGLYDGESPKRLLVPRKDFAEANRIIAGSRQSNFVPSVISKRRLWIFAMITLAAMGLPCLYDAIRYLLTGH